MEFVKYHALGNYELVVEVSEWSDALSPTAVERTCDGVEAHVL